MDPKALLNRKKQLLGPYTSFVMRMFQKLKGTEHESLYAIMYETITNDRKILSNAQINTMKAKLLDLQLKTNGVPFMQKSAVPSDSQAAKASQKPAHLFGGGNQNRTRNEGVNDMHSYRDSRPPEANSSTRFVRKEFYTKNVSEHSDDLKNVHQSSTLSTGTGDPKQKGSQHNGKSFDRRNPDAGYSLEAHLKDSRLPERNSAELSRDPRLHKDSRSRKEYGTESSPRDPRSFRDKSVDPRLCREKSRDPRLEKGHSSEYSPRDPRFIRDKSVDPRLCRDKSRDPRLEKSHRSESSPRDSRSIREKSVDPRLCRGKSRDPRLQNSAEQSTSKERDNRIDYRREDRGDQTQHKHTGGWFNGNGERYPETSHSKKYSNKGWFDASRGQGTSDRYRSRSRHQSKPRSPSLSPPSRNQPQSKFWSYGQKEDRSRSRTKAANINSRLNKSMPRAPHRHSVFGGTSFNTKAKSQVRAQTENSGAEKKRHDPNLHGRRKLHHGMLSDIKDYLVETKKPPPRRMSCFEPKEPEVSKKPNSFGKIRQRRMSMHQPSNDTGTEKAPQWINDGSLHPKFDCLTAKGPDAPKIQSEKEEQYPKASDITVGTSKAIVAAKKILSTRHAEPDQIAKHLVEVFGPELFIAALKQNLEEEKRDDDATTKSQNPDRDTFKEAPSAIEVQETPQKASKTKKPTKVVQLKMAEAIKPLENEVSQESCIEKATKSNRIVPVTPRAAKICRDSIDLTPRHKKMKKTKSEEALPEAKAKPPSKVVKRAKHNQKDVPKPVIIAMTEDAGSSKSSADITTAEAEAETVTEPPKKRARRKGNELDKLHDQINHFIDGSDIASFGSKRACTKQPHNYTGESLLPESHKVIGKAVVPLMTENQMELQYNIKHAKVILKQLLLDGVAMPVKLDSKDRPIIPKTSQLPKLKHQSPISPVKPQKKSSKMVIEDLLVVSEERPKVSPKVYKRSSMWTQEVTAKKQKTIATPPVNEDDIWEDVDDETNSAQKDSIPTDKRVLLKVLANCMDLWSRSLKRVKNPKVKQIPVTARLIGSYPNKLNTQVKPAQPTTSRLIPSTKETSPPPKINFNVIVSALGTYSYQCKLCLFKAATTEVFIDHIRDKHALMQYPKPCLKCGTMSDGSMESEFRHMITHYKNAQTENKESPVTAKTPEADKPMMRLKAMPGDRLSTTSPASVLETRIVTPAVQSHTLKKPGQQIVLAKPPLSLPFKPVIQQPSVVKPLTANTSSASVPAKLTLLAMPKASKQPIPVNLGYQPKTVVTKVYRVVKSSLEAKKPVAVLAVSKQLDTNQQVSKIVNKSAEPESSSVRATNQTAAETQSPSVVATHSNTTSVSYPPALEPSESPNVQFYAEQVITIANSSSTIAIQPVTSDKVLRPWLAEQSAKSAEITREMLKNQKCLAAMFKCMGSTCSFYTNNTAVFQRHLAFHRSNQLLDEVNFMSCAYCSFKSETVVSLIAHITRTHGYDRFQCAYCFFRAYNDFHVFLHHQSAYHKLQLRSLIECSTTQARDSKILSLIAKNVPPLKCFFCPEKFFIETRYLKHLRSHTETSVDFKCEKCAGRVTMLNVLEHFQCHGIGHYQCVYCCFGTKDLETLDTHVAENHSSEIPFIIQRIFSKNLVHPSCIESLAIKRINKTNKTCLRTNFKPQQLINSVNVEQIYGNQCKKEPNTETAVTITEPGNTSNVQPSEVIPTTSSGSASSLLISSVMSLSDAVIVLSSDED